jgi:hypothetical protein
MVDRQPWPAVDLTGACTLGCSGLLEPKVRAWRARCEHGDPAGGEWRRRGTGIMPTMKGTDGDYSSRMAAHSGCRQDELGREWMRRGLVVLVSPFIGPEEGTGAVVGAM